MVSARGNVGELIGGVFAAMEHALAFTGREPEIPTIPNGITSMAHRALSADVAPKVHLAWALQMQAITGRSWKNRQAAFGNQRKSNGHIGPRLG